MLTNTSMQGYFCLEPSRIADLHNFSKIYNMIYLVWFILLKYCIDWI